jgi:hypothetical protein
LIFVQLASMATAVNTVVALRAEVLMVSGVIGTSGPAIPVIADNPYL